jgi:hypothetical protein
VGNQFIQIVDGKQVLVSYYGIFRRQYIHGEVVYSHGDMYLVRDNIGNGGFWLYHCPIGDYARPQSAVATAKWLAMYEFDMGV